MKDITSSEIKATLRILKDLKTRYNANNLSKELGMTPMGTLKMLKRLHNQGILKPELIGKSTYYSVYLKSNYAKDFARFILQKEAEESVPRIKRWITELRCFGETATIGILFGSVTRSERYNDVDMVLVYDAKDNRKINEMLKERNEINVKRIHPIRQTLQDIDNNLKKGDKVLLEAIKTGIVMFGYEKYIEVIKNHSR